MVSEWRSIQNWSKTEKEFLRIAIEGDRVFKVHRWDEKKPAFIVPADDIKKHIKRCNLYWFEKLRKHGAFYTPEIDGHWYLFFVRDEIKNDPAFFSDIPNRRFDIVKHIKEGWALRGKVRPDGRVTAFHYIMGDQKRLLQSQIGQKAERVGLIVRDESTREGDYVWYRLNEIDS